MSNDPQKDLVILRTSLARVAQSAKVSLSCVKLPDDAAYSQIVNAAWNEQRGWNRLAAAVIDRIEELSVRY
jgi:hypothetical protein